MKTLSETLTHIVTIKHAGCGFSMHEKSIAEKSTGSQASQKRGSVRTDSEKARSAIPSHDKGKRTEGELEAPFMKLEMETPLNELRDHLGQPSMWPLTGTFN